jgi:hypothetical protein
MEKKIQGKHPLCETNRKKIAFYMEFSRGLAFQWIRLPVQWHDKKRFVQMSNKNLEPV